MLVATPSNHWQIADALAEGFAVVHVDQHVRMFLEELDPPVSASPVLANMRGGGRLSHKLEEMTNDLIRRRSRPGWQVDVRDAYRVSISQHGSNGERRTVEHDLFDRVAERNPELRRMVDNLRRLLPVPDFTALEGDTVVVGVDSDEQLATLPTTGVRYLALSDRRPLWVSEVDDLVVIDAGLERDEQAGAAVEAVRGLVPA